jgi:hypothetical protein
MLDGFIGLPLIIIYCTATYILLTCLPKFLQKEVAEDGIKLSKQ